MVELDSPEWARTSASPGGTGEYASTLLRQVRQGDESAYDELYHQVCHQFTVGAVAYLAVPHLVDIARSGPIKGVVRPLSIVGAVEAARRIPSADCPALPEKWQGDYVEAVAGARGLAADALREGDWKEWEIQELLGTLAALNGHTDLALDLFTSGEPLELKCPSCGTAIDLRKSRESDGIVAPAASADAPPPRISRVYIALFVVAVLLYATLIITGYFG